MIPAFSGFWSLHFVYFQHPFLEVYTKIFCILTTVLFVIQYQYFSHLINTVLTNWRLQFMQNLVVKKILIGIKCVIVQRKVIFKLLQFKDCIFNIIYMWYLYSWKFNFWRLKKVAFEYFYNWYSHYFLAKVELHYLSISFTFISQ